MTNTRSLGHDKELAACDYLEDKGLQIIAMNYSCRFGEVDVIARDGRYLVFVEVKYRASAQSGYPQEAVTVKKQRTISLVARYYIMQKKLPPDMPVRFDVVAITKDEILHIENAFEAR